MSLNQSNLKYRRLGLEKYVKSFDCGDEDLNNFILKDAPLFYKVRL